MLGCLTIQMVVKVMDVMWQIQVLGDIGLQQHMEQSVRFLMYGTCINMAT